jgi:Ni,Fe-hydrogenase I cytochrome b subunit
MNTFGIVVLYCVLGAVYWVFGTNMSCSNFFVIFLTWPLDLIIRTVKYYVYWDNKNHES